MRSRAMTAPTSSGTRRSRGDLPRDVHEVRVPVDAIRHAGADYAGRRLCHNRRSHGIPASRRGDGSGRRHLHRDDGVRILEQSPRGSVRNPAAFALRRLGLSDPDGGRSLGDPGRLPVRGREAPHVPRRPHGSGGGGRGDLPVRPRPRAGGSHPDRRDPGRRHVRPTRLRAGLRHVAPGRARTRLPRPEPPSRRDHGPHRPAFRPGGVEVHDHDRVLLRRERDGLRLRRRRPRASRTSW